MRGGNDQQAYDRGTSMFSPDGRIYQVEYAREAVKRGAPSVGIRTADGVVLAAQTRTSSSLMESESIEKIHKVDEHVGAASAGHVADASKLVEVARQEAQRNRLRYGEPVGVESLAKEVTDFIQESTQSGGTRPFGASLLLGGVDEDGPHLFATDPSGTPQEWKAVAIGGNREELHEFFEEEYSSDATLDEGVDVAVRALSSVVDDLTSAEASVATVSADEGFRVLSDEERSAAFDEVPDDDDAPDEE